MPRGRKLAQNPVSTYVPDGVVEVLDAEAARRCQSRAEVVRGLVLEFVRETTKASNVGEFVDDATAERIARHLRSGAQ
jgi:metal-responsive CopG/Arc/MetJ family transcriptional regulator